MPGWTDKLPMTNAYFLLVLREFGTTPSARAAIMEGIDPKAATSGGEITLGEQLRQIRNVNRREPPGWGLVVGSRFEAASHGPIGFASVSAPTLGESLMVVVRYGYVRSPYHRFETERTEDTFVMRVVETVDVSEDERRPLMESLLLSVQSIAESVFAAPIGKAEFRFALRPPPYAEKYRVAFRGPVRFGKQHTEVVIPASWLDIASPTADPVTYAESLRKLEPLAARLEGDTFVMARLAQLLRGRPDGDVALDGAARLLGTSGRTLARRLGDAGTSYRDVVEAYQRERATALLADTSLTVAEVGYRLGYEDPANFARAFRRWFSVSPGQFRKHRGVAEDWTGGTPAPPPRPRCDGGA